MSATNSGRLGRLTSFAGAMLLAAASSVNAQIPSNATPSVIVSTAAEPAATGKFQPTWESLKQYQVPAWFRDAKFGIWAHWGPQCEPGRGDWYARHLYFENGPMWGQNVTAFHRETYGHRSKAGFMEVIHRWWAEKWDPDKLVALYKRAGARYFFALANHHDNLDHWDSRYQPWNSVRVGPQKDLIAGWAKAARANGLKFGVSVHAAHAWSWYEPAQGAAIVMGAPKTTMDIKSLGAAAKLLDAPISEVTLLGGTEKLRWSESAEALTIEAPKSIPNEIAVVFKITRR